MKYYEELLPELTLYRNGWTLCISGTGYIQPSRQVVGLGSGNLWNRARQCHLGTQGTTWQNIPCPLLYPQNSDCGDIDKVLPVNKQAGPKNLQTRATRASESHASGTGYIQPARSQLE